MIDHIEFVPDPRFYYYIHRKLLKEAVIKYFFWIKWIVFQSFNKTNIFNIFLLLFLSNIFYSISFYAITILILCAIFLLFYCYVLNSSIEPIEDSINQVYSNIASLMKEYVAALRSNEKIIYQLFSLSTLHSSVIQNSKNIEIISNSIRTRRGINRDFSQLPNPSFLLPLIHCIEVNCRLVRNENKILFLIKNSRSLRNRISQKILFNFKQSVYHFSSIDLKNFYLILVLYIYLRVILK